MDEVKGPDTKLLEDVLPYAVFGVTFVLATHVCKGMLPRMLLSGLLFVTLTKGEVVQAADAAPTSKKQEKKLQQRIRAAQAADPRLAWGVLGSGIVESLEFTEDLDVLLLGAVVFVANVATAALLKVWVTPVFPGRILHFAVTGLALLVLTLYKMEWSHGVITRTEKIVVAASGALGLLAALGLLLAAPPGWLPFDATAACDEFVGRVQSVIKARAALQRLVDTMEVEVPGADPRVVACPLAALAGAMTGLLMAPGLRYGRIMQLLVRPPMWSRFTRRPVARAVARLGFALQVLSVPLWVTPLADALELPEPVLRHARGILLVLVAVLQLASLSDMVQAFLTTAPLQANVIGNSVDLDGASKQALLKRQCSIALAQTSKVALQLSVAPLTQLLCGLLYALMASPSPLAAESPRALQWDRAPSQLFLTAMGFLGWWTTAAYLLWASLGIVLSRVRGGIE